ncbi:MAG: EamA family transporter RarD [Firmicutes bacterium]|nr:EamA family transporter RarD [Bacillota bacterium]
MDKRSQSTMEQNQERDRAGVWYGVLAYTAWGILPLYWKLLQGIPALEILAHRIVWSFVFVGIILTITRGWPRLFAVMKQTKNVLSLFLAGFFMSINWYTYIWAVNSGHVIEASMGYYINPLFVVLLGVVILKEKLNRWQGLAIFLALIGVLIMTIQYGQIPWISLILAISFSLYGLSKKLINVDSLTSLALETAIVMPIALFYIINRQVQNVGALGRVSVAEMLILFGTGVITAIPLLAFAQGAKRIKLIMLGFLQYITPTSTLLLGIFIFKEHFSRTHLIGFSFIWAGLLVFIVVNVYQVTKMQNKKHETRQV